MPVWAQKPATPYRVGVLHAAYARNVPWVEGLRIGLEELGLKEARDVVFEHRFTEGNLERLAPAAAELVKTNVHVIFTSNEDATRAAMGATSSLPIVFATVRDPISAGIVSNLARPRGNVTGVSMVTFELVPKRMEVLKELSPAVRRVWLVYDTHDRSVGPVLEKARAAAAQLKLELVAQAVATADELQRVQKTIRAGDAIFVHDQTTTLDISAQLLATSLAARVPAIYTSAFWVGHGALASYGADYHAAGRQAARLVAKVLRGGKPADLPIEQATKIELALNAKTARSLGITIPAALQGRADKIID